MQESDIKEILQLLRKIEERHADENDIREKILYINKILSSKGSVSVRITTEAYEEVKKLCDVTGISINNYVTSSVAMKLFEDADVIPFKFK